MEAGRLAEELGDEELRAVALTSSRQPRRWTERSRKRLSSDVRRSRCGSPRTRRADRAEALEWHSLHHYWLGRYEGGVEVARQAIEVGTELYSVYGVVNGHGDLGLSLTGLGRHEEALEVFARGAAQGRELELQPRFTSRLLNMGRHAPRAVRAGRSAPSQRRGIDLAGGISLPVRS